MQLFLIGQKKPRANSGFKYQLIPKLTDTSKRI